MDKKFIGLEDAAKQLGVSKDKLNELRESGDLRAYRDGVSWKFRTEEIDKLSETGLPTPSAESSIGLAPLDAGDSIDIEAKSDSATVSDEPDELDVDDLELGDLDIGSDLGASDDAGASDADIATIDEPTVAAEESSAGKPDADDDLVLDTEASGDDAESILLSEAEFGDSSRPPSTIIGKSELAASDEYDLEVVSSSGGEKEQTPAGDSGKAGMSDVRLAADDDGDDLLVAGSDIIPGAGDTPATKFEDLEELEIDLEAESSRILEAEDVAKAREAQQKQAEAAASGESDLALAPSESGDDLTGLSSLSSDEKATDESLTGVSSLEIDNGSGSGGLSGLSSIELADDEDDDFVLGDSGSDITLSGGDSGINLAPSDSGLSLDDASQILGGSAVGSSIDLGDLGSSIGGGSQSMASGELSSSEDFLLTPIGDDDEDDDEDSSQIISIEAVEEDDEDDEDALLGGAMDLGGGEAALGPGAAAPAIANEAAFSVWNVVGLGACLVTMLVCGVMMVDITRSIWSWSDPYPTSSWLIESLLGLFGR